MPHGRHERHDLCFTSVIMTIRGHRVVEVWRPREIEQVSDPCNRQHALFDVSGEGTPKDGKSTPHAAVDERSDREHMSRCHDQLELTKDGDTQSFL